MEELARLIAEHLPYISVQTVTYYLDKVVTIIKIVLLAFVVLKLGQMIIDKSLNKKRRFALSQRRRDTLRSILNSLLRYIVYFVAGYMLIVEFYKGAQAILAGAGILGLAVGFGAQNLVRDVITGFFILLEDQFAVGEYVSLAGVSGVVEEIGLRVTTLRDFTGELHIVPNGVIQQVTNFQRGSMRALIDIGIAYEENIDHALSVLNQVAQEIKAELGTIIHEGPEVLGVVGFGASEVTIRMVAQTKAMEQWRVEREIRKRIKEAFDREGIEIPYPKQVMIKADEVLEEEPEAGRRVQMADK